MKRALQIIVGCIVAATVSATTTANEAVYYNSNAWNKLWEGLFIRK